MIPDYMLPWLVLGVYFWAGVITAALCRRFKVLEGGAADGDPLNI